MAMASTTNMSIEAMKKSNLGFIIAALVLVVLAGFLLVGAYHGPKIFGQSEQQVKISENVPTYSEPYKSPIDFDALQKKNSDIYAWLEITGTDISYPVLQHPSDDAFYLDHDDMGKKDLNGVLYTEPTYNSKDFSDPVVAIYGHHLKSGQMFGNLQQYYTDDFEKYQEITIYTPDEEITYKVFAAVAFSNRHILYYYDCFKEPQMIKEFVDDLNRIRAIGSYVDKSIEITEDDQLLVLSTCLQGDRTCRFLVVGKRIERQTQ